MNVYLNRRDVAKMEYGYVPVIVELRDGPEVRMHANVVYPNNAVQLIRVFRDPSDAQARIAKIPPEDWVDYINKGKNRIPYLSNRFGSAMVLHLN